MSDPSACFEEAGPGALGQAAHPAQKELRQRCFAGSGDGRWLNQLLSLEGA